MANDSRSNCLARLREMDAALARMELELPDDVRSVGADARRHVAVWLDRLSDVAADPTQLTEALREISGLMDALTVHLLFAPGDGPRRGGLAS
jgi:hypothetical protein